MGGTEKPGSARKHKEEEAQNKQKQMLKVERRVES